MSFITEILVTSKTTLLLATFLAIQCRMATRLDGEGVKYAQDHAFCSINSSKFKDLRLFCSSNAPFSM